MEQKRNDVTIGGAGNVAGGVYGRVQVGGAGEFNGDIDCTDFHVGGAANVKGNVKAERTVVGGTARVQGDLETSMLKVGGTVDVQGDLKGTNFEIFGSASVDGNVQAEQIKLKGYLRAGEDVSAEDFVSKGAFTIGGMLNAGTMEISLFGKCQVKEIGGEKIRIHRGSGSKLEEFLRMIFLHPTSLTTDTIEGDDIYLEATTAKVVRGNNVTIGADCVIDLVEYKGNLRTIAGGVVKEQKKI